MSSSSLYHLCHPEFPGVVLYTGRAKNTTERLAQHRVGSCRTTSKKAKGLGIDLAQIEMTIVRVFDDNEEPNAEGAEIDRLQAIGQSRWNFPYAFTAQDTAKSLAIRKADGHLELKKAGAKGRATQKGNGYPELKKGRAIQRANGHPELKKARTNSVAINRAKGYPNLKKALAINRANGYPSLKKALANSLATRKTDGYLELRKALHIRWHINRAEWNSSCAFCGPRP